MICLYIYIYIYIYTSYTSYIYTYIYTYILYIYYMYIYVYRWYDKKKSSFSILKLLNSIKSAMGLQFSDALVLCPVLSVARTTSSDLNKWMRCVS